jgi:sugar phosphate isomerase/epimerase
MKFTLNTLGCPGWTLEHAAEKAREYGYDGVDLRLVDGTRVTPELVQANMDRIRRLFRPDGLRLEVLASSVHLSMNDGDERRENEEVTRRFMELAQKLEVPLVRVFGGQLPAGVDEARGIENVAQSLERLAPEAERRGVVVTLETHDAFSSAAVVAQTLALVPSPGIGATWDMHHTHHAGETVEQAWELLGERMENVHVKDARRSPGTRTGWQLVLLGEGEVPVREGLRLLQEKGYAAGVSVEWEKAWHPEIPEPEVAFPQHLELMREYLAAGGRRG